MISGEFVLGMRPKISSKAGVLVSIVVASGFAFR